VDGLSVSKKYGIYWPPERRHCTIQLVT
jgi:hypothetical protein